MLSELFMQAMWDEEDTRNGIIIQTGEPVQFWTVRFYPLTHVFTVVESDQTGKPVDEAVVWRREYEGAFFPWEEAVQLIRGAQDG